jgi:hypothetical protein
LKYKAEKCLNTYSVVCYTVFPVAEWLFEVKRMCSWLTPLLGV